MIVSKIQNSIVIAGSTSDWTTIQPYYAWAGFMVRMQNPEIADFDERPQFSIFKAAWNAIASRNGQPLGGIGLGEVNAALRTQPRPFMTFFDVDMPMASGLIVRESEVREWLRWMPTTEVVRHARHLDRRYPARRPAPVNRSLRIWEDLWRGMRLVLRDEINPYAVIHNTLIPRHVEAFITRRAHGFFQDMFPRQIDMTAYNTAVASLVAAIAETRGVTPAWLTKQLDMEIT